jgi:hypothetical protein
VAGKIIPTLSTFPAVEFVVVLEVDWVVVEIAVEVVEVAPVDVCGSELQAVKGRIAKTKITLNTKSNILGCPFFIFLSYYDFNIFSLCKSLNP